MAQPILTPSRRSFLSTVALGALLLSGGLTIAFAVVPSYWPAVVLWAVIGGLGTLFNINTGSLRQAIVLHERNVEALKRFVQNLDTSVLKNARRNKKLK